MDKQGCETMPTVRSWHLVLTSTVVLFVVCLMVPWLGAMGRLVFFVVVFFFFVVCLFVVSPNGLPGEGFNVAV